MAQVCHEPPVKIVMVRAITAKWLLSRALMIQFGVVTENTGLIERQAARRGEVGRNSRLLRNCIVQIAHSGDAALQWL